MGIRILVVEDEDPIADFLVRGLREEGFTVERAADGTSAWHALAGGGWDVVLLDWWLPGADGLSVLRRLRQTDRSTPVPTTTCASRSPSRNCWPRPAPWPGAAPPPLPLDNIFAQDALRFPTSFPFERLPFSFSQSPLFRVRGFPLIGTRARSCPWRI